MRLPSPNAVLEIPSTDNRAEIPSKDPPHDLFQPHPEEIKSLNRELEVTPRFLIASHTSHDLKHNLKVDASTSQQHSPDNDLVKD